MRNNILITSVLSTSNNILDYALLDSGYGRKLERFGCIVVDRPEPQAMWTPQNTNYLWKTADGFFHASSLAGKSGHWKFRGSPPNLWPIIISGVPVCCRFSSFHHLGLFPEQYPLWQWMVEQIHCCSYLPKPRLLNLFGYTGVASLLAAKAGAEVTHVDASRQAIALARLNCRIAGLEMGTVRWIFDDVHTFVTKEVHRGRAYHGIILDPPKFGRGPSGETWTLFHDLPNLLRLCERLLELKYAFLILTTYATRASHLSFEYLVREIFKVRGDYIESGELAVQESRNHGRLLSMSMFTRWASRKC